MKRFLSFVLAIGLLSLLASCSGGAQSDDTSFTSTANASETGGKVEAEEPPAEKLASLQDDYEVVIRDSVNWFVMLNHVETDNNLSRYKGILFYTYSGRDIQGEAKAVYNSNPDVLTIQCEDTYNEVNPDIMAYGFVFDSTTSGHMRGGWAYLKAKWQGGTAARLLKGTIGAHTAQ
jgi:hypothetical protein